MPTEIEFENATQLWREFAKRWKAPGPACSIDVLMDLKVLPAARALGIALDLAKNRPDLALKLTKGEPVTVFDRGDEMVLQQPARILPYRAPGSVTLSEDGKTMTVQVL